MNPKQKAQELINNYKDLLPYSNNFGERAKKFALITVDEIINSIPSVPIISDAGGFVNDIEESAQYWEEVKQEIIKL